jgi:tetratricopeptide (TPR) repeat protein
MGAYQKNKKVIALSLLIAATTLSLWAFTYTDTYRHWHWKRASLSDLQKSASQSPNDPLVQYYLGIKLQESGRHDVALPYLERAVGLNMDEANYRNAYAQSLLSTGQISLAFTSLKQFVQTHPDSSEGHLILARFYIAQSAYTKAIEELQAALKIQKDQPDAWLLLAISHKELNEIPLALESAKEATQRQPDNAAAQALLGEMLLQNNDITGAMTAFDRSLAKDNKQPILLTLKARTLQDRLGKFDEAAKIAEQAIALDKTLAEPSLILGRCYLGTKKPELALPLLETAARLAPDSPVPVQEIIQALKQLGRDPQVPQWEVEYKKRETSRAELRAIEDARTQRPDDPAAYKKLAAYWSKYGDVTRTVRYTATALKQEQDSIPVLVSAANALTDGGHPTDALVLAQQAVIANKENAGLNPGIHEALGNALLATGQAREAALHYQKVLEWWPDKSTLYKNKLDAFFAVRRKNPSPAMKLYLEALQIERQRLGPRASINPVKDKLLKAVALEPGNTEIRRELLRILVERNEPKEAMPVAEELLRQSPEDTIAHALYGVMLADIATNEVEYKRAEGHLARAKPDPTMQATLYYGVGQLAIRRKKPTEAVRYLTMAYQQAPSSDPICFALAQALRLNSQESEAQKLLQEYQARREEKQKEIDLLTRISESPDKKVLYQEAIQYYEQRGQTEQTVAIQRAMQKRFH